MQLSSLSSVLEVEKTYMTGGNFCVFTVKIYDDEINWKAVWIELHNRESTLSRNWTNE
jgi:hypothetical protein